MASFTFGAGNARKLLGLPLYALSAVISVVVPRSDRLWVFGSGIGLGEGALPLYRQARDRLGDSTRMVWLARSAAELREARALGFDTVRKDGLRGFWTTLRARVIVVTHGFGDANRYGVRGGFVVQLWHGLPFKHLHLDSPSTYSVSFLPDLDVVRRLLAIGYRRAGRSLSLFPVASERVRPSIVSGFGVHPENVVVTGDLRDDVLLAGDAATRRAEAQSRLADLLPDLPPAAHTVLFAPTWRDGDADPTVPTIEEWDAIVAWLDRQDAALLVRTHPLGRGNYVDGPARSPRIRILGPDLLRDVNPVLWAVDAVVTDYSSIVFDFALIGRPVVFYAPDLATYTSSRGFYLSFDEFTGGSAVTTWSDTLERMTAALAEDENGPAHQHARHLREEFFDILDGGAGDRVLDEILARTGLAGGSGAAAPLVERPAVTGLSFDPDTATLTIEGRLEGPTLVGRRARVEADGGDFELIASRWGFGPLALPSDTYRLVLADGSTRVTVAAETLELRHELFHATAHEDAGGLVVEVRPPLADDERGPAAQQALERSYRRTAPEVEDAVFLESYRGRSAACNPRGIDRALAEVRPSTRRYWSVVDGSVPVPDGSSRLIEGSREWWRVRGSARVLVVNDWLRKRFRRRRHQHVLQTWHGSTLKRLARDRPDAGLRTKIAATREGRRWDALLAQNAFSAEHLTSAYAFRGPVWVEGYPRDDVLSHAELATEVRSRLDLDDAKRVVLYAPTWREDRTAMVDHLDVAAVARALGPDHVLLVRGHSSTWEHGRDHAAPGLVDVTGYPDVSDLLLVADVLVTDYSSVMFDWVSTGRPIVFFVPDLPRYRGELRGFYADLLSEAPGPVVETADDLLAAVIHAEEHRDAHADALRAWQERFAAHDDGQAGRRVVQRMTDAGWFD
jgi:CDP-glycerol glycerophosphotransferase (TagB/SpsB family)